MARAERIHYHGATFHVTMRGNYRQNIFSDEFDKHFFLTLIYDALKKYDFLLHAYCLMDNHVHLLVEVCNNPLASIMHFINTRHANFMNRKLKRLGHLFQSRYYAKWVQTENHFLTASRYIHRNPVEANMTVFAANYPWSSIHTYLEEKQKIFITTERTLSLSTQLIAQKDKSYLDFVNQHDIELIAELILSQGVDGHATLHDRPHVSAKKRTPITCDILSLDAVITTACTKLNTTPAQLQEKSKKQSVARTRAIIAMMAKKYCAMTVADISRYFKIHPATLARAISRMTDYVKNNEQWTNDFLAVENAVKILYSQNTTGEVLIPDSNPR